MFEDVLGIFKHNFNNYFPDSLKPCWVGFIEENHIAFGVHCFTMADVNPFKG